jgi:hypothetical protein
MRSGPAVAVLPVESGMHKTHSSFCYWLPMLLGARKERPDP